jgi:hypothetical protein
MAKQQEGINKLLREATVLRKEALDILEKESKGSAELAANIKKTNKAYKEKVSQLKDINKEIVDQKQASMDLLKGYASQEASLKGLTGTQASLVAGDRERLKKMAYMKNMDSDKVKTFNSIASLQNDLLALSSEDEIQKESINEQLNIEYGKIEKVRGVHAQIKKGLNDQRQIATNISDLSEEQKSQLDAQLGVYEGMKKTIGGILATASQLTGSTRGMIGTLTIGLGHVAKLVGKTTREMGGFVGGLTGATAQVTLLSTIFPDALSTAKGLSAEFGGLSEMSFQTQLNTNLMATNMGISGDQAAQLTGNFARLNGGSVETAQNLAESTKQLAKQNGLVPSVIMADVAGSAKAFAEYGKEGGKNIGEAAVAAGKLGVNMDTLTNVTDSLLDFETSITKELELGAMLGRSVNLSKARQLAFDENIAGAVKETLKELGGIAAFEKMSIYQKRAAADAVGLSVEQFQKMSKNMDKLNADGTMQLSTFDTWSQSLTAFATGPLGSVLQGLGGGVIAAGQMSTGFASMGMNMGGMVKGSFQLLKNLGLMAIAAAKSRASKIGGALGIGGEGGVASKIGGKLGGLKEKATAKIKEKFGGIKDKAMEGVKEKFAGKDIASKIKKPKGKGKGKAPGSSMIESFNKIDMKSVLKGAAAMVILAAALYISAKAFQEFATVKWESVAKGIVGLTAMAGVAYLLGKAKGDMLKGALAVAVLGIALVPFAFAMSLIAGLEIGSVIAAAAGLLIFGAAVFGLGLLMMGPGAFVFGAGLLALAGLGLAMVILGGGLLIAAAGFSAISGALSGIVETITSIFPAIAGVVSLAVPIAIFAYSLFGLALGLAAFGIAAALALPSVMGIAIAIALLGTGLTMMGNGLNLIGGSLSSVVASITELSPVLGTITAMIGPIAMLSMALLGLTASLFGLGIAMAFLGIAGLPGLLVLGGIAAIAGTIIKVAEFFGLGGSGESESSETGGLEAGSLSEYETNMLTKMDQLISATISQRNIYLDKDKVTKSVVDHAEKGTMNTYDINRT